MELRPEEDQYRGQAVVQVGEATYLPFQREVQRLQMETAKTIEECATKLLRVTESAAGTKSTAKMARGLDHDQHGQKP